MLRVLPEEELLTVGLPSLLIPGPSFPLNVDLSAVAGYCLRQRDRRNACFHFRTGDGAKEFIIENTGTMEDNCMAIAYCA